MSDAIKSLIDLLPGKGEFLDIEGNFAFIITTDVETPHNLLPWVWYAPTFHGLLPDPGHGWMFTQFLERGISIAGVDIGESLGRSRGCRKYSTFYNVMKSEYGLSERPCLLAQSRGGLMHYNWAAENAECVACIAGIFTVCDLRNSPVFEMACPDFEMSKANFSTMLAEHNPVDRLIPLVKAEVPILHIHGDSDRAVPMEQNSGELRRRYHRLGGKMKLLIVKGKGHEVIPEFFQCQEFIDFVFRHA